MSSILLREVGALGDLIEQLAATYELSDDVVPLFILICLEKFHNIWVIQRFQNENLLLQSLLIRLVNVVLKQDLDGSLGLLSNVGASPYFTEGTRT